MLGLGQAKCDLLSYIKTGCQEANPEQKGFSQGLTGAAVIQVLSGAWTGLATLHTKANLGHLDVKPENIMVDPGNSTTYLIDYGFSSPIVRPRFGTPGYTDPDLLVSSKLKNLTISGVDAFALGVTGMQVLAGNSNLFPAGNSPPPVLWNWSAVKMIPGAPGTDDPLKKKAAWNFFLFCMGFDLDGLGGISAERTPREWTEIEKKWTEVRRAYDPSP
jgi:serine/threonine protein kinase